LLSRTYFKKLQFFYLALVSDRYLYRAIERNISRIHYQKNPDVYTGEIGSVMKFSERFKIGDREVGLDCPVYIIAEMSANHGKDYGRAVEMVHAAKEAGADAIKLQTYTADTLTLDCQTDYFYISKGPWKGQYLHDLYKGAYMPWEWHAKLKEEADSIGIIMRRSFSPIPRATSMRWCSPIRSIVIQKTAIVSFPFAYLIGRIL